MLYVHLSLAFVLTLFLSLPAGALEPLPLTDRLLQSLDVPVDGVFGTTAILGYTPGQTALVSVPNTSTPQTFTVTPTLDVTPLACPGGETSTSGQAINRRGDVAGFCVVGGVLQGFVFRAANRRQPFAFVVPDGASETQVLGLNDVRNLVGTYRDSNGLLHGLLRLGTRLTTVDIPGASDTVLTAINNHNQFVGYGFVAGVPQGMVGEPVGESVHLEPLVVPDSLLTLVFDINDAGDVVGFTVLTDGTATSFVRLQGTFYRVTIPDVHLIFTDVTGIGPEGHIIGRQLLDNFPDPVQLSVSRGFVLSPPQPGLGAQAVAETRARRATRQVQADPPPGHGQVTVTDCEDLPAGKLRPAKAGRCR